jgi:hypothetical protein
MLSLRQTQERLTGYDPRFRPLEHGMLDRIMVAGRRHWPGTTPAALSGYSEGGISTGTSAVGSLVNGTICAVTVLS